MAVLEGNEFIIQVNYTGALEINSKDFSYLASKFFYESISQLHLPTMG